MSQTVFDGVAVRDRREHIATLKYELSYDNVVGGAFGEYKGGEFCAFKGKVADTCQIALASLCFFRVVRRISLKLYLFYSAVCESGFAYLVDCRRQHDGF